MHEFGISLYPEHSDAQADKEYMELASKYGFTRIFTCLLSVEKSAEETITEFSEFMDIAHGYGFKVAVDTNPEVFKRLGATPYDLEVFHKMGVDIIRLDGHFDDRSDIAITQNPYGIKIEYNASQNSSLSKLIERGADKANMVVCHNFYPERYTGLSEETFEFFSNMFVDAGLRTAAFVSSQQEDTFGPWPVYEGLPTCEEDRKDQLTYR